MPILPATPLSAIPSMLAGKIAEYNAPKSHTSGYNQRYDDYIHARTAGTVAAGSLAASVAIGKAAPVIQKLLIDFGMNAQGSTLAPPHAFQATLAAIDPAILNWISQISLPLGQPPSALVNPMTGATLSVEIAVIYESLSAPGSITASGGYVAASKAMHCLFPELAPMIDGRHTGISYYNIDRKTYGPPLGLAGWAAWLGAPMIGVPNPSPRDAGRNSWGCPQFIAATGINQHIYELWQSANGHPGLPAFLALDLTTGTTGIPRIIDKGLW